TAAFLVARDVLRSPRARDLAIAVLGISGVVFAAAFFLLWGAVWLRWQSIPGAGLPPLDLILPVGPYRHYHVVGILVAILLPGVIALAGRPGAVHFLGVAGTAAAFAVIFMSGSRTVWLATTLGLSIPFIAKHSGALRRVPLVAYIAALALAPVAIVSGAAE